MEDIKVVRTSTESEMTVRLSAPPIQQDYRSKIQTPLIFLNHMLEHIVWRSGLNLEVNVSLDKFFLAHVVAEDLGITVGKAVGEYVRRITDSGIYGYGDGVGIIDEAKAQCAISFESRAYIDFNSHVAIPALVEDMHSEDLEVFLEGFAQGAACTLHVDIDKGSNAHHIWEAVYRALGKALEGALAVNPHRAGMTSGVAGKISFTIE